MENMEHILTDVAKMKACNTLILEALEMIKETEQERDGIFKEFKERCESRLFRTCGHKDQTTVRVCVLNVCPWMREYERVEESHVDGGDI